MHEKRLIRSTTDSLSRLAETKADVASNVDPARAMLHIERLTKPKSLGGTMRKAGIALIAAPDPITGIPGVALLATSFIMKKKEPASLGNLAQETRKVLRDLQSLSL